MSVIALLLATAVASASDYVLAWSYDDYRSGQTMVGVDDWVGGYASDRWMGYITDNDIPCVYPTTDDPTGTEAGIWGDGGPHDNWLVNEGVSFGDARVTTTIYNQDDDTIGLVLNLQDAENYYLFMMTGYRYYEGAQWGSDGSNPLADGEVFISAIVKIQEGAATVLAQQSESYIYTEWQAVTFEYDDGDLRARLWSSDSTGDDPYLDLTATDEADPITSGHPGFYAWNNGGADDDYGLFGAIEVDQIDEDEDGVVDDEDCDETDPSIYPGADEIWYDGVDQDCAGGNDYDADGDGYTSDDYDGADCDDTDPVINPGATDEPDDGVDQDCDGDDDSVDDDTGDDDPDAGDTGAYGDTGATYDTGDPSQEGDLLVPGGGMTCGCGSAPRGATGLAWLLLSLIGVVARRRTREARPGPREIPA